MSGGRSGLAFLDKPAGMTSFQTLHAIKDALNTRRVGHAGTLDRFATGLLVVLAGGCTRLVQLFSGLDKTYRAVVMLGVETDTLDPEGSVVARGPVPGRADLERAAASFRGPLLQVPPAYSALHVDGRRAHELSRAGAPPRMTARPVTIHRLELGRYEPPVLEIEVRCSKGTYVRSLARDLALAAGSRGYLGDLRRLAIGPYRVDQAVSPGSFEPGRDLLSPWEVLQPLEGVSCRTVDAETAQGIRRGRPLEQCLPGANGSPPSGTMALFDGRRQLLAIAERDRGRYRYLAVFAEEQA